MSSLGGQRFKGESQGLLGEKERTKGDGKMENGKWNRGSKKGQMSGDGNGEEYEIGLEIRKMEEAKR